MDATRDDISIRYRIERLDKNRVNDLSRLHKAIYNSRFPNDHFAKKYDTAFTDVQYVGYIAYDRENNPIAYYGVIPCFIQYNGKIMLAAQSADTMTHPLHRYKGLFVKLAQCTYDLCKENGILFVFGFPNQNSRKGLVDRLGWTITENMYRFTIPVKSIPIETLFGKFGWKKWIYEKHSKGVLKSFLTNEKGLSNSSIMEGFGGVYRDNKYLEYKTYSRTIVVAVGNARVWIKIKNGLDIGDIDLGNEEPTFIIDSLRVIAKRLGVTQISFQISPGTRLYSLFEREFEAIPSFPIGFKDFGAGISFHKIKFTFADIDIF